MDELVWKYRISDKSDVASETRPQEDAEGNSYFGTHHGFVISLSSSGEERWKFNTGSRKIFSTPLLIGDVVICVGSDAHVFALHTKDGTPTWSTKLDERVITGNAFLDSILYWVNILLYPYKWHQRKITFCWATPVVRDGKLYLPSRGRGLFVLDVATGALQKTIWLGYPSNHQSSPAKVGGTIFVISQRGRVYAIGENDTVRWSRKIFHRGSAVGGIGSDATSVYVSSFLTKDRGTLARLNLNGECIWERSFDSGFRGTPIEYTDSSIVLYGSNGNLLEIAKKDGVIVRKLALYDYSGYGQWSIPLLHEGLLYVSTIISSDVGAVVIVNRDFSVLREIRAGKVLGTPMISKGRIYFSSWDGYFRCYTLSQ